MNRVIIFISSLLIAGIASAKPELKIEGNCRGQNRKSFISFEYFSTFEGCGSKSEAAIIFTSDASSELKGTRSIKNGLDTYSFKAKRGGQLKTVYWLVLKDSTGNTHAIFKYRDLAGSLRSVTLACDVLDYEYNECTKFHD